MSNKTITILLIVVIGAIGILFALNITNIYGKKTPEKYLSLNNIRGMAVEHKGKEYTLNFEQQNNVANILNRSVFTENENYLKEKPVDFGYDALIIFTFGKDTIKIKPIAFANLQMIFQAPKFNPGVLFRETGPGDLNPLLTQTYDI